MSVKDLESYALLAGRVEPGCMLMRAWQLTGGESAQVTAMEVRLPRGDARKLVVRRHGAVDLRRNPRIAEDEYRLLKLLKQVGLPAPAPYYVDAVGECLGSPCVVVEFIEGGIGPGLGNLPGALSQMAEQLARIHEVRPETVDISFLPSVDAIYARKLGQRPAKLDDALDEGQIRDVLERVWPLPRRNADVLLHGDYWPGNMLWKDGRLVGIVDWEDARVGDPLEDVANSRHEILWAYGVAAMQAFTEQYRGASDIDFTNLPYWDLCAALRPAGKLTEWAGSEERERVMRERHRWFVGQALEADLHFR